MSAVAPPPLDERLILLRVDKVICAIGVSSVREIGRVRALTRVRQAPAYVRGLLNLRGQLITVIDLRARLGLAPPPDVQPKSRVVVVAHAHAPVGLLVDEVLDTYDASPADRLPVPANAGPRATFFTGVYRLSKGLAGALDLDAVLQL